MSDIRILKFLRIDPSSIIEVEGAKEATIVTGPADFIASLRLRYGIVVAAWDERQELGHATRYGVVLTVGNGQAEVRWSAADASYRPNPSGRRWWKQAKPFFGFAPDVVERYMLAAAFAEHFPDSLEYGSVAKPTSAHHEIRQSGSPTGGYIYLIRSQYGIKIGKSVDVRSRTRLFEVKLPFPITVEHYAWFDDYSYAERDLHRTYHAKRLEGEWFSLSDADIAVIKKLGISVPVAGL
jgi:hypothetical protein